MTKSESEHISARIASYIAGGARILLLPLPRKTKKYINVETEDTRRRLAKRGIDHEDPPYERIKAEEARLVHTEFAYWIEDQLRAYLSL